MVPNYFFLKLSKQENTFELKEEGEANVAIFSPLHCKPFQDFIWVLWVRLFYYYVFGLTLQKKMLEKPPITRPKYFTCLVELYQNYFPSNLLLNRCTKITIIIFHILSLLNLSIY